MQSRAARHTWVDAAKGISILLVVMVHTRSWLDYAGIETGAVMNELIAASNHVRMPLFFFVAGLFAAKWVARPWRDLTNGKLALLFWVFLLWQVAMFAYKTIGGAVLPDQNNAGAVSQLVRVVVSPVRPNAELWFLWALVIYFVVAKLLSRLAPVVAIAFAAAASIVWSGVVLNLLSDSLIRAMGPGLEKFPMYFVFFLAACVASRWTLATVASMGKRWAVAYLALWIVLFRVLDVSRGLSDVPGVVFALQLAGLLAGVSVAVLLARFAPLRYLGERTLPVYVTHTTLIVAFASVLYLSGVKMDPWWEQAGVSWLVLGASVGLGLLLYRVAANTFLFRQPRWFALRSRGLAATAD